MVFIKHKWLTWATLGLAMIGLVLLMNNTKTGLVPDEDQGTIMINVTTAPGSSLAETNKIMGEVGERLKSIPQIRDFQQVAGYGMIAGQGNSYGMCIVRLKDWSERPDKADAVNAVIGQIYARTADIKDAQIFAVAPPMITGYGTSTGFEMYLQDQTGGDITDFYNIYLQYIYALNQRPEIQMAYSTFNINFPQYMVDIDAAKAKRAGISPTEILSTLSGYYGGQYVSNINRFSKVYRVMIQADPKYRLDPESLNNVYVRMQNGEMAPISQFVKLTKVYGSEVLSRFNMYNSIAISGTVADGYSTGDAIKAIEEVAEQVLPKGYGYDFGGLTREESQTGSNTAIIFGICIILIYLILSALYESFLIPFAVILAVPCGLLGSFILVKLIGQENNIYLQTGLIMIIGLLSKTAILITEYAADRRKSGMSLSQAAFSAAKARLREKENAEYEAMQNGDINHMPKAERLPWRIYIRDYVDARFNLGEWFIPVAFAILIVSMFVTSLMQNQWASIIMMALMYGYLIAVIIDVWLMWRKLKAKLIAKYGERSVSKGSRSFSYAWSRSIQMRRWRLPKPRYPKRGHWPAD